MDTLARILGLGELRFGDQGVSLEWARPMPAWVWTLIILAVLATAGWSYWRLTGPRFARAALGALRALVLALLVILIAGPQLVRRPERVERDWVVVLLDRSASMTVADVTPGDAPGAKPQTRDQQLATALKGSWDAWSQAAKDRNILWLGFDAGAYDIAGFTPGLAAPPTLEPAAGRRTSLDHAIDQALRRVAARPVAGVVVASDGRSADEPSKALIRRLQSDQIPVFSVPLGSAVPPTDVAIKRVDAPRAAFADDLVPVTVEIERIGGTASQTDAEVRLVDDATGAVLDERPIKLEGEGRSSTKVTLVVKPTGAAHANWSVRVLPSGEDISPDNNTQKFALDIVDVPIRVLQVDGYPRWEFRYLKNLLLRESSIKSASLLLAADRRYIQEGSEPVQAIPSSSGEWSAFDVVVLGDVRPELFNPEQLEQIKEQVALRGAGLLWIGGPNATPWAWAGTPLADLLPFTAGGGSDEAGIRVGIWTSPVTIAPTPEADRLGVLHIGEGPRAEWPEELSNPSFGWTQLRWAQKIDPRALKPATEVLARAIPSLGPDLQPAPLILSMRYGSGRIIYVGTDEIWRWRYARGETLPERFWLPLVRLLARDSLARSGQPATIEATPARAGIGQPVRVAVRLLDQSLADSAHSGVTVKITRHGAGGTDRGPTESRLALTPDTAGAAARSSTFTATWIPDAAGAYRLEIIDPPTGGAPGSDTNAEITLPDDELREPAADHVALSLLSTQTGGRIVPPEAMAEIPGMLPSRQIRIVGSPQIQTLWDRPAVLALFVLLLTFEWVGRKALRLS